MIDFLRKLFDTSDFPARWTCGLWSPFEGWLLIVSDLAVFGAYAAIPISICFYMLARRGEVVFPRLYWLFAAFILSCGLTHLIDATIFWHPWYRLSGLMKAITAAVSWATAIVLIRSLPTALNLPNTTRLNEELHREIEERRHSEDALRESSTRLALALQHSKLGNWSWDRASDLTTLSPRAAEIFGVAIGVPVSRAELLTRLHEEDRERIRSAAERSVAEQSDYDVEYRVLHPGRDEVIWVSTRGRAERGADGRIMMLGTVQDITDRKSLEAEREELFARERAARAEAEHANRIKDEFLATLSHELRTPLHAILGWSQVLRSESPASPSLKEGLDVIDRNVRAQTQLVDDLLDMNRIITGKIRLERRPVDLPGVITAAVESVRPSAEARQITLLITFDEDAPAVSGDPSRLQQIVWNLLVNAIKFTPGGGRVEVSVRRVDAGAEIAVRDTGIGISPDFLPFVFDRFRQEDAARNRRQGGLGLGLAIARSLTELHGGMVEARSDGEKLGATFRVVLPALAPDSPRPTDKPAPSPAPDSLDHPALGGHRILVVDDQTDSLSVLRWALEQEGAFVTTAGSGPEALREFSRQPFDLLISDIGMPEMDGLELIHRVRQLLPGAGGRTPAIALTAFARMEDRQRVLAAGFDAFLAKPIDLPEVVALVRRHSARSAKR